jgi:prepilin-type N-terminal cleavage/methylation domain-containing protein
VRHNPHHDRGFTLVELLIVVALLGVVMTTLSAAAVVVIRVTEKNELGLDDARVERGLKAWLVPDLASTPRVVRPPEGGEGFGLTAAVDPCGVDGGESESLVVLEWHDDGRVWIADYRIEPGADGDELVRYTCADFTGEPRVRLARDISLSTPDCTANAPSLDASGQLIIELCVGDHDTPITLGVGFHNPVGGP